VNLDGSVAVLEPDIDRSRRLQELLEFAHFQPVMLDSAPAPAGAGRWLAAIVGVDQPELPSILHRLHSFDPRLPVVGLGERSGSDRVVAGSPICAYVREPIRYRRLVDALEQARALRQFEGWRPSFPVGDSQPIRALERLIDQVAGFDTTVLIQGESGSGKELVARRIHDLSRRRSGPFVPLNCSAIPRELLESELFGHEKGAFTGAITQRAGRFELAENGTLFLDEIGDMNPELQVKLLRVLQERSFERVGSTKQRAANVRVIAATHRDLTAMVREGRFREDLYFRIHVFPITVPPLRERMDDLPALIGDLVRQGSEHGRPSVDFTAGALGALRGYRWPGNVRELANLIERLAILHPSGQVDRADLPAPYGVASAPDDRVLRPGGLGAGLDLKEHLSAIEKELIRRALEEAGGTVAHAAKLLNLQRTTLVEKLRKHQL
jgi:sigma-54 specific flagellar transcriptional regulator A